MKISCAQKLIAETNMNFTQIGEKLGFLSLYHFSRFFKENMGITLSEYSRTIAATNGFGIPEDFMKWNPTTHHNGDLKGLWERFISLGGNAMQLFYVWGHAAEFLRQDNWNVIEEFCRMAGGRDDIWYATNIEIKDYITAQRNLVISVDGTKIYNPSCLDIWVTAGTEPIEVKAGTVKVIGE